MRKTERNIYAHTIYFGVLMVFIYLVLSLLVNQASWSDRRVVLHLNPTMARLGGQEYLMTRSFDQAADYDLFVVGSSHAYRGYDPRFFEQKGLHLFNAGSSAQHPSVSYQLLSHLAQNCPEKPLIIVDVFDKILEMGKTHLTALKNVTFNEPFFPGHFPGNPVMPGVLIIEAMAQAGGVLVLSQVEDPENYNTYFMKIDNAKFKDKVVPGDTLLFRLELLAPVRRGVCVMKGTAFVGDKLVCEAELMAQIAKK
jgi:beta-hydroxyacyl-ACP dehydratase FabZ